MSSRILDLYLNEVFYQQDLKSLVIDDICKLIERRVGRIRKRINNA